MDNKKIINIAVVVAGIDEEYQVNIINGINSFAKENNINIAYFAAFGGMLASKRFDRGEYSIYDLIDFSRFDGALLMTNTINDINVKERITERVKKSGIPAVVFDCADYPEFCNIAINNSVAMSELVEHIIREHGAKVINYVSGPLSNPEAKARYEAFLSVMAENGLRVEEERIYFGEFRTHDGRLAVEEFSESGLPVPDAFICANDAMALTAVTALEKRGLRVPEDVIVTGFDYTYSARNFSPSLTSVKRPLFTAGYKACSMIMDMVCGGNAEKEVLLDAYPVFSESCGCPPAEGDDFTEYKKRTFRKMEVMNANISMLNRLTARLAETEDASEHFDVIEGFIEEIGCERFSLCLTEDWQDAYNFSTVSDPSVGSYAGYMTAPLIWDKGERRSVGYYPSSNMFPEFFENGGDINYFLPLHFRERCLGYYIITNGDFPINSLLCHTLTMNISNSIENIRKLFHLNKTMDELNRLYVIDPLSNIYNRNGFINIADDLFRECVAKQRTVMLSFVDMDGLKLINDNYGHNEGDMAIQRLASVIQECCLPGSICARFGGDEFVMFFPSVQEGAAEALERKFSAKIESSNSSIRKPYQISASIGSITKRLDESDTLYSIIKQADEKMYEIKKNKKKSRKAEETAVPTPDNMHEGLYDKL